MPTAIPPIPATKATDPAKTPPKRPEREESFKRVLNGARRQIKPKQQPEKGDKPEPSTAASEKAPIDTAPTKPTPDVTDDEPVSIVETPLIPTTAPEELSELDDDEVPQSELPVVAVPAPVLPLEPSCEPAPEVFTRGIEISAVAAEAIAMPEPAAEEPSHQFAEGLIEPAPGEPDMSQETIAFNPLAPAEDLASDSKPIDLSSLENEQTDEARTELTHTATFEPVATATTPAIREQTSAASGDAPISIPPRALVPTEILRADRDNAAEVTEEPDTVDDIAKPESVAAIADKSPGVPRGSASDAIRFDAVLDAIALADDVPTNPFPNNQTAPTSTAKVTVPATPVADPMEARFAETNHPRILTAVQSELVPHGGTVRLRLDPPELGALQVRIDVRDGVLAASFQTSNDEATRLLTQSLQQLKTTLESQGVTVEKLHVHQTPREQFDGQRGGGDDRREQQSPQQWQQQEQQRRELLQRMWRRVRDGRDPFDLVA